MGSPEPVPMRVGDADRERAVRALGEHFAQGRLDVHEFEERAGRAHAARTRDQLDALFVDLPSPVAPPPAPPHPVPGHPVPGYHLVAPHGWDPATGMPYSDKSKIVAGVLQILLPFGIGRFYSGHTGLAVAQLLLAFPFGIGVIWAFIDGIVLLAGRPRDPSGRPMRP
jgi:hypothetical protein